MLAAMNEARLLPAAAAALLAIAAFAAGNRLVSERGLDGETLAVAGLIASLSFAAIALAGGLMTRAPLYQTLATVRARAGAPPTATVVAGQLGLGVITNVALAWSGALDGSTLEEIDRAMSSASTAAPQGAALLGIGVAVAPGIAEELLFRGLVLGALLERFGAIPAVAVSSLLFAAMHLDPAHMAGAAVLGLYLGAVRIATGSTLVCIVCHVVNNAFAIVLATQSWPVWTDWIAIPAAAAAAGLGIAAMRRCWPASVARSPRAG